MGNRRNLDLSGAFFRVAVLAIVPLCCSPARAMDQARVSSGSTRPWRDSGLTARASSWRCSIADDWKHGTSATTTGRPGSPTSDLNDDSGAAGPGNTYGKGTIYTRQQIDQALATGGALATRERGRPRHHDGGDRNRRWQRAPLPQVSGRRPVIPRSSHVKVTSTGFRPRRPAGRGGVLPAQRLRSRSISSVQGRGSRTPRGHALNLGSQGGRRTDERPRRKIDQTVGPGIRLVFVSGPGDQAAPNRAGWQRPRGRTAAIQIQKGLAGDLVFDLFYPSADRSSDDPDSHGDVWPVRGLRETPAGSFNRPRGVFYSRTGRINFSAIKMAQTADLDPPVRPGWDVHGTLTGVTVTTGVSTRLWCPPNSRRFRQPVHFAPLRRAALGACGAGTNLSPTPTSTRSRGRTSTESRGVWSVRHPGEIWRGEAASGDLRRPPGIDVSAPGSNRSRHLQQTSYLRPSAETDPRWKRALGSRAPSAPPRPSSPALALMLPGQPDARRRAVTQFLQQSARSDSFTGTTPKHHVGNGEGGCGGGGQPRRHHTCVASAATLCLTGGRFRSR